MKITRALVVLLLASLSVSYAHGGEPSEFSRYFKDRTFRLDYFHTGTKGEERISADKMYEDGSWPGSMTALVDTMNLGEYLFEIIDAASSRTIFSRGYSSLFNEWQTTDEASAGIYRTFQESVRFPYPLRKFQLKILRRNKQMVFNEIYSSVIDPSASEIHHGNRGVNVHTFDVFSNGEAHQKVDVAILGDGYTKEELPKFRKDVAHFTDVLFSTEPFKHRKKDFNVHAVEIESHASGINQPDKALWVENPLGTTYCSFGSARYVLTDENRVVRDYAATVPYDFLFIIVNTNRYGGGGIFQLYATCFTVGETPATAWQADYVFVHEFGHSFAGLGDEYYASSVAYNEFYQKGVEPWEPNIAANISRTSLKWNDLVKTQTLLPTPWNKVVYDSMENERGKLKRDTPGYAERRQAILDAERSVLENKQLAGTVGAFEGAGYSFTGLFRPSLDCRMFSLSLTDFDPVCTRAINRMIDFYTK